jgi:penicillin-binding protein 1C
LQLSLKETLPEEPLPLPNDTPHLTEWVRMYTSEKQSHTTIDKSLQQRVNELVSIRQRGLSANRIHNMACLVVEVETGEVLSYTGNSQTDTSRQHGQDVDVIRAKRSTGSILKPFLFAGMLDNGDILQTHLVPDVPVRYNGYAPKNYDRGYSGAVPAYKALERSLNIPAVILLRKYGVEPFLSLLRNLGFTSFRYDHEHYGLTLILGGAETSLWELAGIYCSLARVLNHYNQSDGNYFPEDYHMPAITFPGHNTVIQFPQEEGLLSASSIYLTFQSLREVNRPEELSFWYLLSSSRKIAWKTGTSYGSRDAWAVGVTPEYVVAVWAGNADGEGRPGLSGISSAAPLMFDVFSILPETSWFQSPLDDLKEVVVCSKSGYLAGKDCEETDTVEVVPKGSLSEVCPYHQVVHLDASGLFRVNSDCYPVGKMQKRSWFILPPLQDWYYRRNNISYKPLPPMLEGCSEDRSDGIQIVYPERNSNIFIPRELDGTRGKVVMEIAHRHPEKKVFWHLDGSYIATTSGMHKLAWDMLSGTHEVTVVDEDGIRRSISFEVLE